MVGAFTGEDVAGASAAGGGVSGRGPVYCAAVCLAGIPFEVGLNLIRPVLQLGDPRLREKCEPVEHIFAPEIDELLTDLADTLDHWRSTTGYGRAIAAPQIGVMKRVILLHLPGEKPWALINPVILQRSDERFIVWDACLSFLSIFMQVERHREITVRYQNLAGELLQCEAGDERNLAELLQHEIDHLDGILAIDRVTDVKTIVTREEFEKRYRDASPYAINVVGRSSLVDG